MNLFYDIKDLEEFADFLRDLSSQMDDKISSRGWAYILEQKRYINKDQFDQVTAKINACRKKGYLPIDFVAEESVRQFEGVETPSEWSIIEEFETWLKESLNAFDYYSTDWWDSEDYYIQMVVEKVDLVTLFKSVCKDHHIPIANSKGWSSMLQRAEYARRFKEAEDRGLQCVLLYCGDHDPDGLRISEFLRKNLYDLKDVTWDDGEEGYNPKDLIIDRFGLNYDFIIRNGFTWIDNLITGSGKNLASPKHKNYKMPYVQEYLQTIGERKCEANVLVTLPKIAQDLCTQAIEKYLGDDAQERFQAKRKAVREELENFLSESGSQDLLDTIFERIEDYKKENE